MLDTISRAMCGHHLRSVWLISGMALISVWSYLPFVQKGMRQDRGEYTIGRPFGFPLSHPEKDDFP